MKKRIKPPQDKKGWIRWRKLYRSFEVECCDCGLVHIKAKKTVGLIGMTGAGKTTALDILLGLLSPQKGELVVYYIRIN